MQAHVAFIHWRNIVAISDIPPERLKEVTQFSDQVIVPKAGQAVFAVSAEVKSTPGLEDALYWARGAIIESACNLTLAQIHDLAKLRYPGKPATEAVTGLAEDFQRFVEVGSRAIERRQVILEMIDQRRRAIATRSQLAENGYQKLVKSGLGEKTARLHSPEFDAEPLRVEISELDNELAAIETFLGIGNFESLPEMFKLTNGG